MKNLKKLMSVILTVAMLLSLVATSVGAATFADVEEDNVAYEAIEVMAALEILEGKEEGNFDPEANIKRSEFAAVICRAMNQEAAAAGSASVAKFSDVASNHWAAGYINWAAGQGIVNGMGDGTFAPDANVTYEQAVAMIVRAMGFEPLALKRGGFPTGYMVIAASYKVTNGVAMNPANGAATRAGVAQLVYNALDAATMEEGFAANIYGGTMYNIYDGKANDKATLLSRYHGIYVVGATVTATVKSNPALYNDKTGAMKITLNVTDNNDYVEGILLDGAWDNLYDSDGDFVGGSKTIISTNEADAAYLGYEVKAFVALNEDDEVELVAVVPNNKKLDTITINNVKTYVETASVASTADTATVTFKYWEDVEDYDATELELNTLKALNVYKNGVAVSTNAEKKTAIESIVANNTNVAEVTLLGKDDVYHSLFITEYRYEVVKSVDADRMQIKTKTGFHDFSENGHYLTYNFYKDGAAITLADIKEGDILNIINSGDKNGKKIADFYVTDDVLEGSISTTSGSGIDTIYTIDGEEYYATSSKSWKPGYTGQFYITIDGRILDAEISSAFDGNYALVLSIGKVDIDNTGAVAADSFNAYYQLELLTKDNVVKVYNVASSIKVESEISSVYEARTFTVGGKSNGIDQKTLFIDDDNGNLADAVASNKNAASATVNNLEKLFITFKADGDTITHISLPAASATDFDVATGISATYGRNRLGNYKVTDSTYVFSVKLADNGDSTYSLTKDSVQVYDSSRLEEDTAYAGAVAFAINEDREVGALAMTDITSTLTYAPLAVVINTSVGTNAAGEPADMLNVMVGGEVVSYVVADSYASFNKANYSKGDVVQFTTDAAGEIDEVKMIYNFTLNGQASTGVMAATQFDGTAGDEKVEYVAGVVVEHDDSGIEIKYGSAANATAYFSWNLDENSSNVLYTVSKGDRDNAVVAKSDIYHINAYLADETDKDTSDFTSNPYIVVVKLDKVGDIVDVVAYEYTYMREINSVDTPVAIDDLFGQITIS